jgi:hypothetical protein
LAFGADFLAAGAGFFFYFLGPSLLRLSSSMKSSKEASPSEYYCSFPLISSKSESSSSRMALPLPLFLWLAYFLGTIS